MEPLQLSGLSLSPLEVETDTAKFDLTLSLSEGPEGLTGSIEYNTDLFDSETIERMAGHFQTLLEGSLPIRMQDCLNCRFDRSRAPAASGGVE